MLDVNQIKSDLQSYAGGSDYSLTQFDTAVARVAKREGADVFLNDERLMAALREERVSQDKILGLLLLSDVDGFEQLVSSKGAACQADLDRILNNSERQSGLSRAASARYLRAVCLALGVASDCLTTLDVLQAFEIENKKAYVVPAEVYDKQLLQTVSNSLRPLLEAAKASDPFHMQDSENSENAVSEAVLSDSVLNKLNLLVQIDYPLAKYYMGAIMLYKLDGKASSEAGLAMLEEEASCGNSLAAAELADYYFGQGTSSWDKAFSYYTGFGAPALTKPRQNALEMILNQKTFNQKVLRASVVLLVAMLLFVLIAPGAPIIPDHRIVGLVCFLLACALYAFGMLHYRNRPYGSFGYVPTGITLAWAVFVLVRLLV